MLKIHKLGSKYHCITRDPVCVFGRYCVQNMNWTQQYIICSELNVGQLGPLEANIWLWVREIPLEVCNPVPFYHPLPPGDWNRTQQITLLFMQKMLSEIFQVLKYVVLTVFSKIISTQTQCVIWNHFHVDLVRLQIISALKVLSSEIDPAEIRLIR